MTDLIKICGLRTPETLDAALDGGADMVGFVHFPRSPRHVSLDEGRILTRRALGRAERVALLVDPDDATVAAVVEAFAPDWIQLHGHEPPDRVATLRSRFGRRVMKAIGIEEARDLDPLPAYAAVADALLLDAKPPRGPGALPGGNGLTFDWRLIAGLDLPKPVMVSGGLTPGTVAAAIAATGLRAVDVSSGVEHAPGDKDPDKIAAFIEAARAAFAADHRKAVPA